MGKESKAQAVSGDGGTPRGGRTRTHGGHRPGGGWKPNWFRIQNRAQAEQVAVRIVNEMLWGKPVRVEVRKGRKKVVESRVEKLDPQVANACINALRLIVDSKKFTESLSARMSDDDLMRRLADAEAALERYAELLRGRGIPEHLIRGNGGSHA